MLILENILLALDALRSNKSRAFLTMLGIIIGIASVIAIMTLGNTLSTSVSDSMSGMGASNVTIGLQSKSQSDEVVRARVSHLLMAQSGESTDQMLQMAHDCLSRMRLKRARAQYDEIMKRIKTLSGAEKMQALDEAKQLTATINRLK